MEQNIKQNFLSFEKGITNTPSDVMADDNSLTDAIGLTYQEGEYKPIQEETQLFEAGQDGDLIFVHKTANFTHYIFKGQEGQDHEYDLSYKVKSGNQYVSHQLGTINGYRSVTAIGSILVLSTDDGLVYYLYNNGQYSQYNNIPEPQIEFSISNKVWYASTASRGSAYDIIVLRDYRVSIDRDDRKKDYEALVTGLLAECRSKISKSKGFYAPFFIRYGLRLNDGSYTYISNPVLMFPAVRRNAVGEFNGDTNILTMHVQESQLQIKANFDYQGWGDIVKGVDVFITSPIEIYDLSAEHTPYSAGNVAYDKITQDANETQSTYKTANMPPDANNIYNFAPLAALSDNDIMNNIKSASVFYKLCDLGIKQSNVFRKPIDEYIKKGVVENIENQYILKNDDYFSRTNKYPHNMYAYNSRLNLAGLSRGFFEGFDQFMPYSDQPASGSHTYNTRTFHSYVYIHSENGDKIIHHQFVSPDVNTHYYYYPDPRAYRVVILEAQYNHKVMDATLTEHPALNGAYYLKGLPNAQGSIPIATGTAPSPLNNGEAEELDSTLLQSEVLNPFVFKSTGDTSVGTGAIIGLCSNTKAISQGQYGQHPLFVFTTEGIYAMSVNNDGTYGASTPFEREVCSNPKSITPIDGAIMFVSKKGLMMITDKVTCVSSMLNGKPHSDKDFNKFISGCNIAYDYQANLLHIINDTYSYRWIYNLKSGTFARLNNGNVTIGNIVNDYPDTLIQKGNDIYSFYEKPIETEDQNTYSGTLKSRPCKFGELLVLKSIRQLRHIYNIDEGSLFMRFCASNDLVHWYWLNSITGAGWKYYKFEIHLSQLKATDRYVGLEVITQPRRTNKIR